MAAKYNTVDGTIVRIDHAGTSVNGNPRYRLTLDGGAVMQTQSDAAINYGIQNPEYRNVPVTLVTTRAGRVVGVRTQDGQHKDGPQS
jgi:hypothetical protein